MEVEEVKEAISSPRQRRFTCSMDTPQNGTSDTDHVSYAFGFLLACVPVRVDVTLYNLMKVDFYDRQATMRS